MEAGKGKVDRAKESIFKKSEQPEGAAVAGYDYSKPFDLQRFLDAYGTTGFQATNLKRAIDIARKMREGKTTIFLGYTSNMVSSGVREAIVHLVKNRLVHALVTTAGGVEEDIVKCVKPFVIGKFDADGIELRKKGINRIGNIFVPNDRYIAFERQVMTPLLTELWQEQKADNMTSGSEFCRRLGKYGDESSILYWAARNDIPVFCPSLTDGAMGDNIFFFKHEHPDFKIDVTEDVFKMNDMALDAKETGAIILGGSVPKHFIMNANMMREGTKYTIYINTSEEWDGSDSGAKPSEAESWGKISAQAQSVKVFGDATIIFPLLVAGAFV